MKQFKLVDSLNTNKMTRHIKACNSYMKALREKLGLDKYWKREHTGIKIISVITKQEIWVKG